MKNRNLFSSKEKILIPPPARTATQRGVIFCPQPYALGMASLAVHSLYTLLNENSPLSWERAFLPPSIAAKRHGAICSVETGTPLSDFAVIAITSSYELDWLAVPQALAQSGIPPLRAERKPPEAYPLIIVGGAAISTAPLPLAEIYDVAYIGEIEPVLPLLRQALACSQREETLEHLAAVPGFFVPALAPEEWARLRLPRRYAGCLDDFDTTSAILTPEAEFPNRFLIEIGRGCGRSCRFCLARQIYWPQRWRSLSRIIEAVQFGRQYTPDIGFIAAAVSDYPHIEELCEALEALPPDLRFSTSSLRLESAPWRLLSLLARRGQKTVTFAPEAATERLRKAIGKALSDEELFAAVQRAVTSGLKRLRLYFMLGLPTETQEDRQAIAKLAQQLHKAFPTMKFQYSLSAFAPRPHTPFERMPLAPLRHLRLWLSQAQRALWNIPNIEVSLDSARWAAMQTAFARADHRLGLALARHFPSSYREFVNCLAAEGLDIEALLGEFPEESFLPWKVVDPRGIAEDLPYDKKR